MKENVRESSPKKDSHRYLKKRKKKPLGWILVIVLVLAAAGAAMVFYPWEASRLYGLWSVDEVTSYRFEADGVGALVLPAADYPFTYQLENGAISIDFKNPSLNDAAYHYSVEGTVLTLDDQNSAAIYTLNKVSK